MKIEIKKIKKFFKKLPRILGKKAFFASLSFILFSLILGSILFYQYSVLAEKREPEITGAPLRFQEKNYEDVLKIWQERENKFEAADIKEYPDPFSVD